MYRRTKPIPDLGIEKDCNFFSLTPVLHCSYLILYSYLCFCLCIIPGYYCVSNDLGWCTYTGEYDSGYPKASVPSPSPLTQSRTPQQLHSDSAFVGQWSTHSVTPCFSPPDCFSYCAVLSVILLAFSFVVLPLLPLLSLSRSHLSHSAGLVVCCRASSVVAFTFKSALCFSRYAWCLIMTLVFFLLLSLQWNHIRLSARRICVSVCACMYTCTHWRAHVYECMPGIEFRKKRKGAWEVE